MGKVGVVWFFVHLILGLYFINMASDIIALPELGTNVDNILIFIGGIFIIISGIFHLKKKKKAINVKELFGK